MFGEREGVSHIIIRCYVIPWYVHQIAQYSVCIVQAFVQLWHFLLLQSIFVKDACQLLL